MSHAPVTRPNEIDEDSSRPILFRPDLQDYKSPGCRFGVDSGIARSKIRDIFSIDETYVFMRTSPNQKALKFLPRYVAQRPSMNAPWQVRLKKAGERVEHYEGASDNEPNGLWYSNSLVTTCLEALRRRADAQIGSKSHCDYQLMSGHPGNFISPTIHVIKGRERAESFKGLVPRLLDDEGFKILSGLEAPQNYHLPAFQLMRDNGIPPLVIDERQWEVSGKGLRDALDFLAPCEITMEYFSLRDDD